MREPGVEEALRAAGGVTEPARRIGIAQPSVSMRRRMSAEGVLAVAGSDVDRTIMRSGLYGRPAVMTDLDETDLDEVDAARAEEYALLATLLARAPDAGMLERLASLRGDASPLGAAHAALADAASRTNADLVQREFFELFIGLGRGELVPYGSYYLTGFLYERPLARLREDLARIGIERAEGLFEPEDHAAILCEIMSGLVSGALGAPGDDRVVFERHVKPWMGRFFADLEQAEAAKFYRAVGQLGHVFMDIENEAFALAS
ncbi:MAG: molecular chaperone TorD family protein [Variibacter sp.]|nr:molecular chaperone TorD family protein [Variibacter sp.]